MKINYDATAKGSKKKMDLDVSDKEMMVIAGIFFAATIFVGVLCFTFGLDPMVIIERVLA